MAERSGQQALSAGEEPLSMSGDEAIVTRGQGLRKRPAGSIISIVGPDGSGKSTLIDNLLAGSLAGEAVVNIRFPGVLPRRSASQGPVTEPHKHPPYNRAVSLGKLAYIFLDYLLGWMVRVRPFVRRGGWVIIQRGWWDIVVDPRRYRLDVPPRILGFLARLLPSPDLILILEAPPEVVYRRKTELSLQELDRQMRAWRTSLPAGQQSVFLDASLPPDAVARVAEAELLRHASSDG